MKQVCIVLLCCLPFCVSCLKVLKKTKPKILQQNDWSVESDPSRPKGDNEYDVIVVGAGVGGLSCASLLAQSGYKVLVIEQDAQVGGYCTSYVRQGFIFPVGPHDISGCEEGSVKKLLDILRLRKENFFTLNTRTYVFDAKKVRFTGTKRDVLSKLSEQFPEEHKNILAFFFEAEKALEEAHRSRNDASALCPTYESWKAVSYQQKLTQFFSHPQIKQFFCSLFWYVGAESHKVMASDALQACGTYFLHGGYYPLQGGKLFVNALRKVIESHGGTVLTNTRVDEILVKNGSVDGVRTGKSLFVSNIVVANANAKTTLLHLVTKRSLDPAFCKEIETLSMSPSLVRVNLGLALDLSSFSSIVKVMKDGSACSFFINSNADASMAPFGNANISIDLPASYDDVPLTGSLEYKKYKEQCLSKALEKLEKVIPGIKEHIVVFDVMTPRTLEEFTSMPEGALYAFSQEKNSMRPMFKVPIKGLYLVGASTFPGAGIEAVVASGMICWKDILSLKRQDGHSSVSIKKAS